MESNVIVAGTSLKVHSKPGSTGVKNSPIDSDLKSILKAPLDSSREGDVLQGEDSGQSVGLPPSVCSLRNLLVASLGVSGTTLGAGCICEQDRWSLSLTNLPGLLGS